jgi:hypothetical protein
MFYMLPTGLLKEYSSTIAMFARIVDMVVILMAAWLAYFIRFDAAVLPVPYCLAVLTGLVLTPCVFSFLDIYASLRSQSFVQYLFTLLQAVLITG